MSTSVQYIVAGVLFFTAGLGAAAAARHWDAINALLYASSLARHEIMAGTRGPVTYLVFNDNFDKLQEHANADADILGVEQALSSNVAKVAFVSADSASIKKLAQLPYIGEMINRNVPMICH